MTLKKTFTIAVVAASLFGGTLVAIPLLASAQDSSPSLETNSSQEIDSGEDNKGNRHNRGHRKGAFLGEVLLDLGLDPADVREGFANGQTLGDTAEANGISANTVVDAIVASMTERLNQAVADGKITAEEAAEKAAGIPDKATEIVNTVPDRKDDREDKDRGHRKGAFLGEVLLDLGLDPADVREGFANGQTLGDTAEANGISANTVVDAIVASMTERLNQAVADGKITAEEAAEKAAGIPDKATEIVNTVPDRKDDREDKDRGGRKDKQRRNQRQGSNI